ncbi:gliding motility-associated C-terminal domain-containing protein [Flavobacterium urocaniciphilum]|nr:gliding motility-associated C-terminal domain-containing protein [Flavobacterium urocaniciphilum]
MKIIKILFTFSLFLLSINQSYAQIPNEPVYTPFAPTCPGGNNGRIVVTNIGTTGARPISVHVVSGPSGVGFYLVTPDTQTTYTVTNLVAGSYVLELVNAAGDTNNIPVVVPAATPFSLQPESNVLVGIINMPSCDTYTHQFQTTIATGATAVFTYTNSLGNTLTVGPISGTGANQLVTFDIPESFFTGNTGIVLTGLDSCGNNVGGAVTNTVAFPDNTIPSAYSLNQIFIEDKGVLSISNPAPACTNGYTPRRKLRAGVNPVTITITGGNDMNGNPIIPFSTNITYRYREDDAEPPTEIFPTGLAFNTAYTIAYTDACGETFTEDINTSAPVDVTFKGRVLARQYDYTELYDDTSRLLFALSSLTHNFTPPFKATINSGPNYTSQCGTNGDNTVNYTIPYPLVYNNIPMGSSGVLNVNTISGSCEFPGSWPAGTYNITVEDACGRNSTFDIRNDGTLAGTSSSNVIKSTGAIEMQYTNCSLNAGTIDATFVMNTINFNNRFHYTLYRADGTTVVQSGQTAWDINSTAATKSTAAFNNLEVNTTYIIRYGGVNFSSGLPAVYDQFVGIPRYPDGHIYQYTFTTPNVVPFYFSSINSCATTITANASGGSWINPDANSVNYPQYQLEDTVGNILVPYQTSGVFAGLVNGNSYVVQAQDQCGTTINQTITIFQPLAPTIGTVTQTTCTTNTGSIVLNDLPPHPWYIIMSPGNVRYPATGFNTGSTFTVPNLSPGSYTFTVSTSGCTSASSSPAIQINSQPENVALSGAVSAPSCSGSNYTISLTVTGTAPFVVTGTGAPGSWVGNTWTSGSIASGVNYNVDISDANSCNTLNVNGAAGVCCALSVTCPTFPATSVQCYSNLPSQTVYTIAEFQALGNGDGIISNPCGVVEITATNSANTGLCIQTVTRTYTITEYVDDNNNGVRDLGENTVIGTPVNCTQAITVQDTIPPVLDAYPGNYTIECSVVDAPLVIGATDNCGTANVTFNQTSTAVAGTCANYTITRTWTATDSCGLTTSHTQTITVQDTTAPTFVEALPANVTVECNAVPTAVTLTATDNCGTATVTFNETTTAGTCPNNYTLTRTWTATDLCGLTTSHTQTITVQDTTAPTFVEALPANVTIECNALPTAVTLTATDNCGTATVTFNETTTAGTCPNNYTLTRTWTATDLCGLTTSHTQTITVQDTTAPTFVEALPANVTIECNALPTAVTLTATDNCGTATVTFNETATAGTCPNNYTLTRTWTAIDLCGLTTSHTQTITVQDTTAPTFLEALPSNLILECTDVVPTAVTLTATDNCSTATVTFNETTTAGSCPNNYTITRTWTATDVCGLTTVHTQTITVEDTTAPIFNGILPQDGFADCDNIPAAATLTATDNCGNVTITYDEQNVSGDCSSQYKLIRTWTATDDCGNASTHTQTISLSCYVKIWNAVSPDGDGVNDIFFLEGIDCYPNNSVEIYNRWGVKVFETKGYDNTTKVFKGYSDGRATINTNELLPTGTYFYILKYEYDLFGTNKQNIEKTGYLYIQN